jgi:hypothetical protein
VIKQIVVIIGVLKMQRELLRPINVDSKTTVQIMIIYSAFVKYLRKNGDSMMQGIIYL